MAKMKNPFKKKNVLDTVVSVGLGGAANVAIDAAVDAYNQQASTAVKDVYVHAGKFVIGALGSAMVGNKYAKAALDGVGVVGASNLIAYLMDGQSSSASAETTSGVPAGTIGRIRTANAGYARRMRRSGRVAGIANMVG